MSVSHADEKAAQVAVAVSLSFLVMTNVVGNTLVILIILTNKSMKSPMNYLFANLAVPDIMVGVFLTPRSVFNHLVAHPEGVAGKLLCILLTGGNIFWVAFVASSLSLVAISFERYFAVVHPLSAQHRLSSTKVKRMTIGSWICAVIFDIPLFFIKDYDIKNNQCVERWPEDQPLLASAYSIAWFLLVGLFPIAVMFVLYSKTIYTLWFKRQNQVQGTQLAMLKSRKRVTKMAVIVSVVYAVCMFPNLVMYLINQFSQIQDHDVSYVFSVLLVACNSAINPFIYTLQSANFRRHLIKLMCCKNICKNRVGIQKESCNVHETPIGRNVLA